MKRLAVLMVAISMLCGCARVHRVDVDSSDGFYEEINRVAAGHKVSVELVDGRVLNGTGVSVAPDSTRVHQPHDGAVASRAKTTDVRTITVYGRGRGALHGAGIGAVSVGSLGAALGAIFMRDAQDAGTWEYTVVLGVLGAAAGSVGGFFTGLFIGNETVYEFPTTLDAIGHD